MEELSGMYESIDELSTIFEINIINELNKKENYYYWENDLIELYILDFKKIINDDNIEYLNNIFNINIKTFINSNLTKNKSYKDKLNEFKKINDDKLNEKIKKFYNDFYFNAFNN